MNIRHIAPSWARWLIIPALIGFAAFGIYLLYGLMLAATFKGPWWIVILGLPIALFPLLVAYRGLDLVRFRNIRAAVLKDELLIQECESSEPLAYKISSIEIINRPAFQVIHVVKAATQKKLMTVDYYYSYGMSLMKQLEQYQAEQVAASDR